MVRRPLGQLEAEVLAVLASAQGELSPADVQARLSGHPAYTTVNTVLSRLHGKQFVSRARRGRHFAYRTVVDEPRLVADRMCDHLRYASDPCHALNQFVRSLNPDEEQLLRTVLDGDALG
ncbi:BlaI/MecI/CopY family transcriptional regulator [Actinomadura alba]|uniref:BlaI/MecI/CopY family transcriptional regulator n=1 Tax=Actinomadura alba TaxID=406431 RepID=A0ABR7LX54_9ACTN|nr:BlaI/MecI/CopY family transcriptional regulator [Actinomadura alba]